MGQAFSQTSRLLLTARLTINSTIFLIKIRQVLWTSRCRRANRFSQINRCTQVDFTCRRYRLDRIPRKTTASNFHMHLVPREHRVANKMQNRHGITRKASIMLCLTDTSKTKTDICKFNNSNNKEMEVHSLPNRINSSSWDQPLIWAIYRT